MAGRFIRGVVSVLGSKVGTMLIGVISTPILVRLLGSAQYGQYAAIMSLFGLLIVFPEAGVFDGMRKYIPEQRQIDDWESYVFGFYFRWSLAISLVVTIILLTVAVSGFGSSIFPENHMLYFTLIALLLFATQFSTVFRGALMGLRLEHYSESLQVIKQGVFAGAAILLVYIGYGVLGAVLGNILGAVTISLLSVIMIRTHLDLGKIARRTPSTISGRDLVSFNIQSAVLALLTVSLYHTDILLLQLFIGGSQTGYYKAALAVAQFIWAVPMAIQLVLVQSVAERWSAGEKDQVSRIAATATRYTLAFTLLIAIGLAALADVFVPLYYGSDFTPTTTPLLLLLPGVVGFAVARPIFAIGQGIGSLRGIVLATGGASLVNLILNLVMIPRYGMQGAAVATSVGYGSMAIFHIISARKIGYNPIADLRPVRIAAAALVLASLLVGLRTVILSDLVALLLLPPLGGAVYLIAVLIAGVMTPGEVLTLLEEGPIDAARFETYLRKLPSIGRLD